MNTKIKSTKSVELKKSIKGSFTLTDGTKTIFEIDKEKGTWDQWNNTTENLCITTSEVERISNEYFNNR